MSTKREEERNEKIIRGLMKLPPNRRCINCNSLGPQYVCTNFWTFVCMTCSGIHREFTHRVKSVSMAKFTSQEVDALQKGGNQRARELFLKTWDPQRQRFPDNSNADKVREFIKNVYVHKTYAVEKSSDRPPRDPQSLRIHEDETRRASSYHSYSQSPPYDFQYEERRYGKHAPALTRKPGSDRGLYEGKLSSFLSPTRSNDENFANEGSVPRASDYSVSSGGDLFKSDVLSPSSQRDTGSPFSETSRDILNDLPNNTDANSRNTGRRMLPPQRTASLGSLGSVDSNSLSFKSATSMGSSHEAGPVDLFSAPFAPQNVTSAPPTYSTSQIAPESSGAQFVDFFQKFPASVPTVSEQQIPPSSLDLFLVPPQQQSSSGKTSSNEGWATFDVPRDLDSKATENRVPSVLPSTGGAFSGKVDPFSSAQSSSSQDLSRQFSAPVHNFWLEDVQNIEGTPNNTQIWNAFEDSSIQMPTRSELKTTEQVAADRASDADKSFSFGVYETLNNDSNIRIPDEIKPPSSSLSSDFSMTFHDFSMTPSAAGVVRPVAADHKPTNPFDLPYDSEIESGDMSQFWDMSSLDAALPNHEMPTSYVGDVNQSWFQENSVAFDSTNGSLGFMGGQAPNSQIANMPAQGPVASIGGNPFA